MTDIDWSKAPDWATHVVVKLLNPELGSVHWSCLIDGEHRVSPKGLWYHPDGYRVAGQRPKEQKITSAWNGEGLPPIGAVCEIKFGHWNEWEQCTILCVGEKMIFIRQLTPAGKTFEGSMCRDGAMFRAIRTPEQIRAEERDKARDEVLNAMAEKMAIEKNETLWQHRLQVVGEMLDMGYLKQVQP